MASCGADAYCWIASVSFWIMAAGDLSSSGSSAVWFRRPSASTIAFCAAAVDVAPSIFSRSEALAARVMEASRTPPPLAVTRLAILRVALGSFALATLRETMLVCSAVVDSPDKATSRPTESDIPLPFQRWWA